MEKENPGGQDKAKQKTPAAKTFPGILLRIILVLVTGAVIGAVVYFSAAGWVPYFDQRIFEPIAANQDQLQDLAGTQSALETQVALLTENLEAFQDASNLTATQSSADQTAAQLAGRVAGVESAVETVSAFAFTQVPGLLATLTADQQASERNISALATAQMNYFEGGYESDLLKIMALLSRANQYLLHDNFGLAEDELTTASQILAEMIVNLDGEQQVQALELLSLIDEGIADLPAQPLLAKGKLELAWQLSLAGFQSAPGSDDQATPTPSGSATPTPTPTPN